MEREHQITGGEVWTDQRGEAVVVLPDHLHGREVAYKVRLYGAADPARASAELADGHLIITTASTHTKIAWKLADRTTAPAVQQRSTDMNTTSPRSSGHWCSPSRPRRWR